MPSMRLKDIKLVEVKFQLNDKFEPKKQQPAALNFEISTNGKYNKKTKTLKLDLCVKLPGVENNEENIPFFFDIKYRGLFEFADKIDKKLIQNLIEINCPAIVFPYLRDNVADLTRRSGLPPLHLPVINFRTPDLPQIQMQQKEP